MESQQAYMRRKLDNDIAHCINTLVDIKNNQSVSYENKLKMVRLIHGLIPEITRSLIYFLNQNKGN